MSSSTIDTKLRGSAGRRCWSLALALPLTALALTVGAAPANAAPAQVAVFPAPGTPTASPTTQISIRGVPPAALGDLTVQGSSTGVHTGRVVAQPDGTGTSFLPSEPFTPGETVTVNFTDNATGGAYDDSFTVEVPAIINYAPPKPGKPRAAGLVQHLSATPKLKPPSVKIVGVAPPAASRDIFVTPNNKLGQSGPMILAPNGQVVWFHRLTGNDQAFDFEKQSYDGKPVLTWWQGAVLAGYGDGEDEIYNTEYKRLAVVKAADGYQADIHEFQIVNGDDALITSYNPVRMNLTSIGGPVDGTVFDGVVQEVNIKTGLMLFEWHSLGNVPLSDSYAKPTKNGVFDYFHVNSIELLGSGNFVVSARNTWAAYEINHLSGRIMWQLGGKHPTFTMGPNTRFAYQHDARLHAGNLLTLFDNGGGPRVQKESRGLELRLNMKLKTAKLVRQWKGPRSIAANSQGNVQRLPGGKTFVGWGNVPIETEYAASGRAAFNVELASGKSANTSSYRGFRFPWNAVAPGRPAITTAIRGGKLTVSVSWNGATAVSRWRVLAGASAAVMTPVLVASRAGFQTTVRLTGHPTYVSAEALGTSGRVLGRSILRATSRT